VGGVGAVAPSRFASAGGQPCWAEPRHASFVLEREEEEKKRV
jgi:hypothetical protein